MRTTVVDYIDAFKKHYPHHEIKVKYVKREDGYLVFINGDSGGRIVSHEEMIDATRMFNR